MASKHNAKILKLRAAQWTYREIADHLRLPLVSVHRAVESANNPDLVRNFSRRGRPKTKTVGSLTLAQLHALFEQDVKPLAIAVQAGVHISTIYSRKQEWERARSNKS